MFVRDFVKFFGRDKKNIPQPEERGGEYCLDKWKIQEKKNKQANQNPQPKLDITDIAKMQTQKSTIFKDFN